MLYRIFQFGVALAFPVVIAGAILGAIPAHADDSFLKNIFNGNGSYGANATSPVPPGHTQALSDDGDNSQPPGEGAPAVPHPETDAPGPFPDEYYTPGYWTTHSSLDGTGHLNPFFITQGAPYWDSEGNYHNKLHDGIPMDSADLNDDGVDQAGETADTPPAPPVVEGPNDAGE